MDVLEALMIAVSGFLVVFIMLVFLWGVIVLINRVITAIEHEEPAVKPEIPAVKETEVQETKAHEIYGGEIALYDVDEKTAACIMAIVADTTGIPLDQLIFRSIRALD